MNVERRPPAHLIAARLGEAFAISTRIVSEVVPMPQLSRLPGSHRDVLGVGWVRNAVRVVRTVAGGGGGAGGGASPALLLVTTDDLPCVAVDEVTDLRRDDCALRRVEEPDLRAGLDGGAAR